MASATSTPAASTSRASRTTRRSAAGASPSSSSPTRLTRIQEKEELRHLNDRLAAYIERVRHLENDKASMQLQLEEKEESKSREVGNLRLLYETELMDARKMLDTTAKERARLEIEFRNLTEEHLRLKARNKKKESELSSAVSHCRSLEATLNSKEAECANLLAGNRGLENEISELRSQVSSLESALRDAKTHLQAEVLRRVDLENQVQTVREQMDFQKHLSEEEVKEMRTRHETRLVEVDSGRQKEFESKLCEAMQQLRREHDTQILQYKEELEKTFSAKEKQLGQLCRQNSESLGQTLTPRMQVEEQLENAQQAAAKSSDLANSTREELAGTKLRLDSLSAQLTQSQKQNCSLESRVRDLEELLDSERRVGQRRLTEKEQEMAEVRRQMQAQLEEYENLLDVKLALDMEINAYRKMLEGEEQRLNLTPSPSQHGAVGRTRMQGARRARKRKLEERSLSSPGYRISQHATAQGNVSIDEIDLDGNYVKLRNNSDTDQPIGGWVLRKSHRAAPEIAFHIPPSYVLSAGRTLTIWGSGAGMEPKTPGELVWRNQQSWGPVDDIRVTLVNPHSEEVAERSLVRVPRGEDGDSEVECEEEEVAGSEAHLRRQGRRRAEEASCAIM